MSSKKSTERQKFFRALREIAATHESLYALASRLCSGCRRPPSLDPEDHLHDAVLLILELVRKTPEDFQFPLKDMTPERWVYQSVRRVFHSKAFYHREFAWASRRMPGNASAANENTRGDNASGDNGGGYIPSEEAQRLLTVEPLVEFDALIEDLCDHVPVACRPLLRLLSQGATSHQAATILGKKRSWVQWRLAQVRKALALLPSVRYPKAFTKTLLSPKK